MFHLTQPERARSARAANEEVGRRSLVDDEEVGRRLAGAAIGLDPNKRH